MEKCVVYKITNIVNNRIYIGVSINFNRRMNEHKRNPPLKMIKDRTQYDWENDFYKEILFENTKTWCFNKENDLIRELTPYYNTANGEYKWKYIPTNKDIMEIRYLSKYGDGYTQKYLSILYDIRIENISNIIHGIGYEGEGPIVKIRNKNVSEDNSRAILSIKQVESIRIMARDNISFTELSTMFNVCSSNIGEIVRGKRWKEAPGPIQGIDYKGIGKYALSNKDIEEVRLLGYMTKDSYVFISKKFNNVSGITIGKYITGKSASELPGLIFKKDYMARGEGNE